MDEVVLCMPLTLKKSVYSIINNLINIGVLFTLSPKTLQC